MSQEPELPSDSDEDDVDYVPGGEEAVGSEIESDGDAESGIEDDHDENEHVSKKKRGKQRKGAITKRRLAIDCRELCEDIEPEEKKIVNEEEEKKKADSLWADFMKDTGSVSKPIAHQTVPKQDENVESSKPRTKDTVKITKIFEFAGEEVKVEEEVSANSVAARLALSECEEKCEKKPTSRPPKRTSGGLVGMQSVLGQMGKKPKISTLEKSKLDWANFKKEQNLDDEINTHNRGKDGYLERQDFLQRADLRQFEIEKKLRTVSRRSNR